MKCYSYRKEDKGLAIKLILKVHIYHKDQMPGVVISGHHISACHCLLQQGAHTAHAAVAGPRVLSVTFLYFLMKAVHFKELTKSFFFFHIFLIDCSVIVPELGYYKVFLKMKRFQRKSLTEIFAPNCVLDVRGLHHGRSLIYICNSPKPVQYFSFFFFVFR